MISDPHHEVPLDRLELKADKDEPAPERRESLLRDVAPFHGFDTKGPLVECFGKSSGVGPDF